MENELENSLLREISKYPNGAVFFITLENGLEAEVTLDTIYETDNGLEEDEPGFKEYMAALFVINKILKVAKENVPKEGSYFEVSILEPPKELQLLSGENVWKPTA
ncbi:hypothetical protein CEW92_04080 [Bacillaceae bacterium SAS-127]|nr:hypothetical protein CEW92_04080 [Bacillaceae bacterium SAS-127]